MENRAPEQHIGQHTENADTTAVVDLIEEVSIDGMCGVY